MTRETILKVERTGDDVFVEVVATPTDAGIILAKILNSFDPLDKIVALRVFADTFQRFSKDNSAQIFAGTSEDIEELLEQRKTTN